MTKEELANLIDDFIEKTAPIGMDYSKHETIDDQIEQSPYYMLRYFSMFLKEEK